MIDGYHTLRVDFDLPKFEEIHLSNSLILAVDSDHARDNQTCRSCHSIIALVNNASIDWKTKQQKYIVLLSTSSETCGTFAATKKGLYLQDVAE